MEVLWSSGPSTVRGVIDTLPHDPAYTTIATVLHNLERKGMVRTSKDGRSTIHHATQSREAHAADVMRQALASSPDRRSSMLHFVESMGADDLDLLRRFLADESESS